MKRFCLVLAVLAVAAIANAAAVDSEREVSGRVFTDENGNRRCDPGEKGVGGISVSDGRVVVATDSDGTFRFKTVAGRHPFVFICTPAGFRASAGFYQRLGADNGTYDFGLVRARETAAPSFSFVQATDIHISGPDTVQTLRDDLREIKALADKPRFVIFTGDLVNQGQDKTAYADYCRAVAESGMALYHVIGNHDAPVTNYEAFVGPTYYSFDYGPKHFVVLNCLEPGRYKEWLKRDLDRQPPDKGILVFQHYQPDKELLELLSRYPVQGFFYGHWHSNKVFRYKNILVAAATPLRFGGIDVNPRGYRVVTVDKSGSVSTRFQRAEAMGRAGQIPGLWKRQFRLDWHRHLGAETGMSSPRLVDGRLYIGVQDDHNARNGGLVCLDARDGKVLWRFTTGESVNGTPAVGDGLVCVVSVIGTVYAVDAVSGQEVWRSNLGSFCDRWVYNSPVIADGVVYCGVSQYFAALDLKSGRQLWQAPALAADWISCRVSPAVDAQRVFIGVNWSSGLSALDRQTGKVVWTKKEGCRSTHSSPLVDNMTVFYAADGQLYSLDKASGKEIWKTTLGSGWPVSTPVAREGVVVLGTTDGRVAAFEAATGRALWSVATGDGRGSFSPYERGGSHVMSSPTIAEGKVYVGSDEGRLYVIDLKTGTCLRKPDLGFPVLSTPVVSGDRVYVARWDGTILAMKR